MDQVTVISIFLIVLVLFLPILAKLMKRHPRILFAGKHAVFGTYILANLYLTLLSRPKKIYHHMRLKPFWSYVNAFNGDWKLLEQIILNIFLYVPLGYLLHFVFPKLKPWHVIVIGVLMSGMTESIQLFFKLGLCEVDDVMNNTMGTLIGMGCYWGLKKVMGERFFDSAA